MSSDYTIRALIVTVGLLLLTAAVPLLYQEERHKLAVPTVIGGVVLILMGWVFWGPIARQFSGPPLVTSTPRARSARPAWWPRPIPKAGTPMWPLYVANEHEFTEPSALTLHDLYLLDFFSANDGDTFSDYDILKDAQGHTVVIQKIVQLDIGHGSRTVAFYLPYWNDTYGVASLMVGRVQPVLDHWAPFVVTTKPVGDADVLSSKDVPFDHRVYFYSEKELTAEEIGDLARIYKQHGLLFLPRSQSYLAIRKLELRKERPVSP